MQQTGESVHQRPHPPALQASREAPGWGAAWEEEEGEARCPTGTGGPRTLQLPAHILFLHGDDRQAGPGPGADPESPETARPRESPAAPEAPCGSPKRASAPEGHGPSWQIDRETVETVADFIFWGSKITEMVTADMTLKDAYSL